MKFTSIAISGQIASGTSTAGKTLAENLKLRYESAGDFFRRYALENNIPLHDKAQIPDDLDKEVDEAMTKLAQKGGVVIDAHYIGYFTKEMPNVLRVLLTCDDKTRVKRALSRTHTHNETEEEIVLREQGLDNKFRKLYANEDFLNPKFFNLVIDTTSTTPKEVVGKILEKFNSN